MEHFSPHSNANSNEAELFRQLEADLGKKELSPCINTLLAHRAAHDAMEEKLDDILRGEGGHSREFAELRLRCLIRADINTFHDYVQEVINDSEDYREAIPRVVDYYMQQEAEMLERYKGEDALAEHNAGAELYYDRLIEAGITTPKSHAAGLFMLGYSKILQDISQNCLERAQANKNDLQELEAAFAQPSSPEARREKFIYRTKTVASCAVSSITGFIKKYKNRS